MTTVGSLAYSIICNSQNFTAGIVASKSELRTLKDAFVSTQTPTERFSGAIDHLTALAQKFPAKADVINRSITQMRGEMAKAEFDGSRFGQVWNKIGFNIDPASLAIRGVGAAFDIAHNSISAVIERIESLRALSIKAELLGVPERSLIGLSEAAEKLSGTDLPTFEAAFTKMSANVASAAMDPESDAGGVLNRLGLDPSKLSGMRADKQFLEIADAMQKVENAGERLALSKTLLGKGGVELASMLAAGGYQIREIMEAEIAASQIDVINIDNMKDAHEAMDDLGDSVKGLSNVFANNLAPSIATTARGMGFLVSEFVKIDWKDELFGENPGQKKSPEDVYKATVERSRVIVSKETAEKSAVAYDKAQKQRTTDALKEYDEQVKEAIDIGKIEQQAADKINKEKLETVNRVVEAEGRAYEAREKKAEQFAESSMLDAEKLGQQFKELQELQSGGFFDLHPEAYQRNLRELKGQARDMANGGGFRPQPMDAVRAGSAEALRAKYQSKNMDDKSIELQAKQVENSATANTLLGRIETALTSNALREAGG